MQMGHKLQYTQQKNPPKPTLQPGQPNVWPQPTITNKNLQTN